MALKAKLGQQSSVETIRRAAARERLRRVVDVRGIDHSDMVASAVQGNCKGDPGAAGGFEDDEGGLGRNTGGSKLLLEGSKASGSLLEGARRSWRLAVPGPSGQEGGGSNVDTGDELRVRRQGRHWYSHLKQLTDAFHGALAVHPRDAGSVPGAPFGPTVRPRRGPRWWGAILGTKSSFRGTLALTAT